MSSSQELIWVFRDEYAIWFYHGLLLVTLIVATIMDRILPWWRTRTKRAGASATIKRGETSMATLHVTYGALVYVTIQVVNQSVVLDHYRVTMSLIDIIALTHLSYFNNWWRNLMIGKMGKLHNEDR